MGEKFELTTGPVDDLKHLLEEVDVFWFRLGYKLNGSVLTEKTKCKILATPVTGIDHIDEDLCRKLGIKIMCLRGESQFLKEVRATSEHTILLTMMLMRKVGHAVQHTKNGLWDRDKFRGNELYLKKIGILGLGRLGYIVAELFEAFGCEIYFYDVKDVAYKSSWKKLSSANEVVRAADVVTVHIPYNERTHHIYNKEFFKEFNNNKWLVNTSRGGVIDEEAMLLAFEEDKIGGLALDVLEGEPDNINSKTINRSKLDNRIIITPHIGGNTYESFEKTEEFIANKICDVLNFNT